MTEGDWSLPVAGAADVRRAVMRLVLEQRRTFTALLGVGVLAAGADVLRPWFLGSIIDEVQGHGRTGRVDALSAGVVAVTLFQVLCTRYGRLAGVRFGEAMQVRLREQFLDRVLSVPVALVERAGSGDLATRAAADVLTVGSTLRDAGPATFVALLKMILLVVAATAVAPILGLVGTIALAGCAVTTRWYLRRASAAYLQQSAAGGVLAEQLSATAEGAKTIDAFRLERQRVEACDMAVAQTRRAQEATLRLRSVLYPVTEVAAAAPMVVVLLLGYVLLDRGTVTLGAVVAVVLYMQQLPAPLAVLLTWVEQLQSSAASMARVEGLALAAPERAPTGDRTVADERMEMRGVSYAYGGSDVLHDIDLVLEPGERLALVGPSGAGKTTLGWLLAGGDRPRAGQITVGGVPLHDLPPSELRHHVALVTQDQHLFLGTLRENLVLGAPSATDDDLRQALAVVEADWFELLPEGLDTEVGGSTGVIDAGQVQQIALARVLLADPHTVILDEATALLRPDTARRIERSLGRVLKGRTIVAIAHRLDTARAASRIGIMVDGRLVELGSHEQLLERGGAYASLWSAWATTVGQ